MYNKYEPRREITYLLTCEHNEDSSACTSAQTDQDLRCLHEEILHPCLSKMFSANIFDHPANAQADLNHRWAHMSKGTFLTLWLV